MESNGIKVLVGCEESQAVCIEFRKLGFDAYSCDIQECSGGHPEWHFNQDIFEVIKMKNWDCMIAFPPCTYLTVTGARWLYNKDKSRNEPRWIAQAEAVEFVKKLYNSGIEHIAIENPIGKLSSSWMKPTQIIQPYYFGDEAQKTTCLWLKNLPKLLHNKTINLFDDNVTHVSNGGFIEFSSGTRMSKWYVENSKGQGAARSKARSKTFPGIAKAMATQWGEYLIQKLNK